MYIRRRQIPLDLLVAPSVGSRAMASKKKPSTPEPSTPAPSASHVQSPAVTPSSATHTWASLLAAVAPPTEEQLDLYAIRTSPAVLVDRGSHIRSEKIRTDMVRLCGIAAEFWPKASKAQRRLLLGFSEPLLRVTVYAGKKLGEMIEQRMSSIGARETTLAADTTLAQQTHEEGMNERERLVTAFEGLLDYDATLETRLNAAKGRASDDAALVISLVALAKLGRSLLDEPTSILARQLVDGGVTLGEIAEVEALAARVKSASEQGSGARTGGPISQAELDLQDGICLAHLERVLRVWNRAHEHDPAIPQLLPIATRRIFSPNRKRPAAEAPVSTAPADVGKPT